MPTYNNRPATYNRGSLAGGRSVARTQQRQNEALRLRQTGMAYADIARQLGYRGAQGAAEACRAASRRLNGTVITPVQQTTATPSVSGRTFGIEAEFYGITPQTAVAALQAVGIVASWEGYTHRVMPGWKVVTDASVTSRGTNAGSGLELVSPILQGEAGLAEAAKAVTALLNAGGKTDRTCGLHVHVGMDGLTGASIMKVLDLYAANQHNINGLVARSRNSNSYCEPLAHRNGYRQSYYDQFRGTSNVRDMKAIAQSFGRYSVVNLSAYAKYGTVEFRQHQGTLNGKKVVSWVRFLMGLIETAVSMNDANVSHADLATLLGALNLDGETTQYLTGRAERLARTR